MCPSELQSQRHVAVLMIPNSETDNPKNQWHVISLWGVQRAKDVNKGHENHPTGSSISLNKRKETNEANTLSKHGIGLSVEAVLVSLNVCASLNIT